ncbi:methyl-accepting chemotaxis protein [Salinispira pacifica]
MQIRSKLFSLILLLVFTFAVSVAVYFVVLAPVGRIESERAALDNLRTAFNRESVELNRLMRLPFDRQLAAYREAATGTEKAFAQVRQLKILPTLNSSVAKAISVIGNLRTVISQDSTNFTTAVDAVRQDAVRIFQTSSFDMPTLLTADPERERRAGVPVAADVQKLLAQMQILDEAIQSSTSVVTDQFAVIDSHVASIESRSRLIAIAIILVLVGLTFGVFFFLTGRLAHSIRLIEAGIAAMKEGDLTTRFTARSNDEIGTLAANLNLFSDELKETIARVQDVSRENVALKDSLIVSTEQTSASFTEINSNVESIGRQIAGLDERFAEAARAVEGISRNIGSLNTQIQEQMAMVEQSTASVTEMIASLENVASITEKRRVAAEQLRRTTEVGGQKAAAAFGIIRQINDNVDNIRNITGLIGGISAQTNLLAMNAAIEAAHAGEAGRGFSVVADEIRKLSEASAGQSKEIDRILRLMVDLISQANDSGGELNDAIGSIEREVNQFSSSLVEIASTMGEIRTGSDQVLQAMVVLQNASNAVKQGSGTIRESSVAIEETMRAVERVSTEVHGGMSEITSGTREISEAVADVVDIAEHLGRLGESLDAALRRFRTGDLLPDDPAGRDDPDSPPADEA